MATTATASSERAAGRAPRQTRRGDGLRRGDLGGQAGDRRVAEEVDDLQVGAGQRLPQLPVQAEQAERVPAQVEEVVVDPDRVEVQHLPPRGGNGGLDRAPRSHERLGCLLRAAGGGSAARSTLPFGLRGSALKLTNAEGTM